MLLLSNVLLCAILCCSICNFGILENGRTESRMYLHQTLLLSGKNDMEALRMLKVALGGQTERTQVYKWFCIVIGVNCAENAESLGCPMTVKRMKLWIEWRNLSSEAEKSLYLKLLTCWEFNLGQFRVF